MGAKVGLLLQHIEQPQQVRRGRVEGRAGPAVQRDVEMNPPLGRCRIADDRGRIEGEVQIAVAPDRPVGRPFDHLVEVNAVGEGGEPGARFGRRFDL